jgi:hypothetical protein
MSKQRTWTPEELEQHLRGGGSASPSDRVWIEHPGKIIPASAENISVMTYLRPRARELRRERKISFAEALRILCNETQENK